MDPDGEGDHLGAPGDGPECRQGRGGFCRRHPQDQAHRGGGQGVVQHVLSGRGQVQGPALPLIMQQGALAAGSQGAASFGLKGGPGTQSVAQGGAPETPGQPGNPGIIGIIKQAGFRPQGADDFALGPGHPGHVPHPLGVGPVNVGEHSHGGRGDLGETADLPEAVHAHLHHRGLVGRIQLQKGEGQADEVIQVQGILVHLISPGQNPRGHLLGGGLAATAGDGHHRQGKPAAPGVGQVPQGGQGGVHRDYG